MKTLTSHGVSIQPMPFLQPGRHDSIAHTLKHFLRLEECWGSVPPGEAISPHDSLEKLKALGSVPSGFGPIPDRFWNTPWMREIHDQGYYPRYARLACNAGAWGVAGSLWHRERGERWTASVRGYRVAGNLSGNRFIVVSAYQLPLIAETRPASDGLFSIGERLKDLRQKLPARASAEEDDEVGT